MLKLLIASALAALALSACGGGGDSPAAVAASPIMKISFYGNSVTPASTAVAHVAAVAKDASDAVPASSASDAAATVSTLQDALTADGVSSAVTVQVMNGTTLHQLIMGTDNGQAPTQDQFKVDPSEWIIVNFQLDDMVTSPLDPVQAAAITQFQQDLTVFIQRAHVAGKQTFIIAPIATCDAPYQETAAFGLLNAEEQASGAAFAFLTGGLPDNIVVTDGVQVNSFTAGHMGSDCRTPDAYLDDARVQAVAADVANRYKLSLNEAAAPAAASN